MSFPSTLTGAIDGVTEIVSAHLNNLEEKVGVDSSAIASSLDYKLRSASSVDPGHKHTAGAFTGGFIGDVFFKDPADSLWKPVGPDSANLVTKTGAQVIAGVKTFTSIPVLPASDPIADNEATRKAYVNAQDALKVSKAGDTMSGPLAMGSQNITGVGTLAAATAQLTNPLAVIYGGIGSQSPVRGDILVASNATTLQLLASVAANNVLVSAGVAQVPFWSKVDLRTMVQFVLPAPNGGTGQSGYAVGDLLYASASDALSKLAAVATGNVLVSGGTGAPPAWGKVVLTAHVSGILPVANGGTGDAVGPRYGEVYFYTATGGTSTDVAIDTASIYHAIVLNIAEGRCLGFTSQDGQANPIASVAEDSAGVSMKITTTGNHNLTAGECVSHTGFSTKTAYRGKFIVQSIVSPTVYVVLGTYTGTDTGFMKRGFSLKASAGSAGVYRLSWSLTGDADENTTQIKVEVNRNVDDLDNIAAEVHLVTKNLDESLSASGLVTIADGDFIWMSMANLTDGTDFNIRHLNLHLVKV